MLDQGIGDPKPSPDVPADIAFATQPSIFTKEKAITSSGVISSVL